MLRVFMFCESELMSSFRHYQFLPRLFVAWSLLSACFSNANAAGFYLIDQSVTNMGTAYAGGAAMAEDVGTIYFNPAGLLRLQQGQLIGGLNFILTPESEFHDYGSSHLLLGQGGLGSDEGGNGGVSGVVPNFYVSAPLSDSVSAGLGVNAPFGLSTEYNPGWIGRYHAVKSDLKTININPALAFRLNQRISLGFGINYQYIEAEISNAIDIGTLNALPAAAGGFGGAYNALGLSPAAADGFVTLDGDDWSWGYNVGLLIELDEKTRFGFSYRSKISHSLQGQADFTIPGGGVIESFSGLFVDTGVQSAVALPAIASASVWHALDSRWALMADLSWTEWSNIHELRFDFDSAQPDGVTTYQWRNTRRYAIGTSYSSSGQFIYRFGIAYDETPIPNAQLRNPRLPGEDRVWFAVGLGYQFSSRLSFDFAYAHLMARDPAIRKTATSEDALLGGLNGDYEASGNTLSVQLKWLVE